MSAGNLRILYVDDEPDIRTIGEMSLRLDPALDVRVAGSGAEALAILQSGAWQPDLLLLDVMMPGMDGPTLFAEIRKSWSADIPAIFMTARAQPRDVEHYLSLGAIGVILKPFDPMQLAAEIREIAGR